MLAIVCDHAGVRVSGVGTTSVGLYLQRRDVFRKQLFVPPA